MTDDASKQQGTEQPRRLNPCSHCSEEHVLEFGHANDQMRIECPCGTSGPWGQSFDAAEQLWNGLNPDPDSTKYTEVQELATKWIHTHGPFHASDINNIYFAVESALREQRTLLAPQPTPSADEEIETPLTDIAFAQYPVMDTQRGGDAITIQAARAIERRLRREVKRLTDILQSGQDIVFEGTPHRAIPIDNIP